jgi:hypothetical protein
MLEKKPTNKLKKNIFLGKEILCSMMTRLTTTPRKMPAVTSMAKRE